MTADHVAQQRPQMVGDIRARARCAPLRSTAAPAITARSSVYALVIRSVSCTRFSGVAHSAARRPASRPLEGPSGSSSARSASRWSLSASYGLCALAAQLEAPQRPGQLVAVGRAAGDEVAERAQLVLLLGGDDEHAVRTPARAQRERAPGAPPPDARPARAQPSVTRPSPNRRSARSRSRKHLAPCRRRGACVVSVAALRPRRGARGLAVAARPSACAGAPRAPRAWRSSVPRRQPAARARRSSGRAASPRA